METCIPSERAYSVVKFCHWIQVWPLWCSKCSNIEWYVSLIYAVIHWIMSQSLVTPMFLIFKYWIVCQPDSCSQASTIESIFSHSDVCSVSILDDMSAWTLGSGIEYWVNVRPLRCFCCYNIGLPATPMFLMLQYWMPDSCGQVLNIESIFGHSDFSSVSILNDMSAWPFGSGIEYWVNVWPLRCFRCYNIGLHVSLIYTVRHWILSRSSATPMLSVF